MGTANQRHQAYLSGYKARLWEGRWWFNRLSDWQFRSTLTTEDLDILTSIFDSPFVLDNGVVRQS